MQVQIQFGKYLLVADNGDAKVDESIEFPDSWSLEKMSFITITETKTQTLKVPSESGLDSSYDKLFNPDQKSAIDIAPTDFKDIVSKVEILRH